MYLHTNLPECNDMPNGKLNGMPCKDYFLKTGHQHCRDFQAAAVCCSSRRKVCDNCFGDTAHVLLNNMTCEMLLETQGLQLCDHHLVVQHCCSTRAAMCGQWCPSLSHLILAADHYYIHNTKCNGDNPKAQFFTKDSKLKDCTTIFQTDDLASVCAEPTILKSCCESFSKNCIQSPLLG
ncbi:uncharacterized protein LOC106156002 [Lingula anatina]|uniref:Uncharacterized protein LOC106156002 n=1 Tax=Lingula anatina TaxID=7574 RepID=A0A1S3HM12_LINAN|nr:uncharacterized protein LOC106156002 [Lingula anatina]|eukprot:XP_013386516.1 uncharacterized protein LOC106156002 [Lingula anatina]